MEGLRSLPIVLLLFTQREKASICRKYQETVSSTPTFIAIEILNSMFCENFEIFHRRKFKKIAIKATETFLTLICLDSSFSKLNSIILTAMVVKRHFIITISYMISLSELGAKTEAKTRQRWFLYLP